MKKSLALTLALASVASIAHAQDAGGFRIGVKVGGTYSNINGRDSEKITGVDGNVKYKPGFNAGLAFTIPVTSDGFASFAPEILVNRKGYSITSTVDGPASGNIAKEEFEYNRSLTYIDVPLLFKINTGGLFFELGPQVGYMARSSQEIQYTTKYRDGTKDKNESDTSDSKEDLASFDIGGVAGLGYQTAGGFSVGVRYNQGFKTLFDTKNVNGSDEDRAFNSAYMVQLGYLIPTK
ncbi:porin family protein [Hymenobacter sediminicola]|uniref:PorT family protein n=1 Tax=Hymenobacter sediminicola TaxID=2761579 RepID=A0A7G7W8S6_9BACT|nr:porin family protein [Hymenobacter sediminicola]QNH62769.1 PorT family protein [Hymenobacter sediminicola]